MPEVMFIQGRKNMQNLLPKALAVAIPELEKQSDIPHPVPTDPGRAMNTQYRNRSRNELIALPHDRTIVLAHLPVTAGVIQHPQHPNPIIVTLPRAVAITVLRGVTALPREATPRLHDLREAIIQHPPNHREAAVVQADRVAALREAKEGDNLSTSNFVNLNF